MVGPGQHRWVWGLLGAWAVGAVDRSEEVAIVNHLDQCAPCAQEAAQLREAMNELVAVDGEASPRVWEQVLSTIHGRVGGEAEGWLRQRVPADIRVALVDDDSDMRVLWRAWLARAGGFEVVGEANNGDAAVALAVRQRPDVLVLDLAMPGRSGLDALRRLSEAAPATRVLACSAYEELLSVAAERGAAGGILKTVRAETLPESVRRLVGATAG
jgi:CheY-like chemotaxis protein